MPHYIISTHAFPSPPLSTPLVHASWAYMRCGMSVGVSIPHLPIIPTYIISSMDPHATLHHIYTCIPFPPTLHTPRPCIMGLYQMWYECGCIHSTPPHHPHLHNIVNGPPCHTTSYLHMHSLPPHSPHPSSMHHGPISDVV